MQHSRPAGDVDIALAQRVDNLMAGEGAITFPAAPALVDAYTDKCIRVFAELGRLFDDDESAQLRGVLQRALAQAHAFSQRSSITVSYRSGPAEPVNYTVSCNSVSLADAYQQWVATREEQPFGQGPDARVMSLAATAPDPSSRRVLDVGAGTGRNALALARRGHPVDAAELTEGFAEAMRTAAQRESLNVRVIQRDVFDAGVYLRSDYAMIVLSGVVSEFRSPDELRAAFELAAGHLAAGGALVFNIFVAVDGYIPDDAARQFAQQAYSAFFTRAEVDAASAGLPLQLVSDDSVHDYERAHLRPEAWPPTPWYVNWVNGRDVFSPAVEPCPIQARWLVYRRS